MNTAIEDRNKINTLRKESVKVGIIYIAIGIVMMAVSIFLMIKGDLKQSVSIVVLCGVFYLIMGIIVYVHVLSLNKHIRLNMFRYNFDYRYELMVYKNVGNIEKKKTIEKNKILFFEYYSEWKDYIVNKYIAEDCMVSRQLDNFIRFLNSIDRQLIIDIEHTKVVCVPLYITIVAICCGEMKIV